MCKSVQFGLSRSIFCLCVLLSSACVTTPREYISYKVPDANWHVGFDKKYPEIYGITEYVRKGETVENWTELITSQSFASPKSSDSRMSPEDKLEELKQIREKHCPGSTDWNIIDKNEKRILYEGKIGPCLGWPNQHEIALLIYGKYNLFRIAYGAKVIELRPEIRAEWIETLLEATVITNVQRIRRIVLLETKPKTGNEHTARVALNGTSANKNESYLADKSALMVSAMIGHPATIRTLIDGGADVNAKSKNGTTALMLASENGNTDIVRILLEEGANINAKHEEGGTALIFAAAEGHAGTVLALLNKGATVHAINNDGFTALNAAAGVGLTGEERIDIVQLLLDNGAEVNAKDDFGETTLMRAAIADRPDTVRFLLDNGADVNAQTREGMTALMFAAQGMKGLVDLHLNTVQVLLEAGSDVNAKDNNGRTAIMRAEKNGHKNVAQLLRDARMKDILKRK